MSTRESPQRSSRPKARVENEQAASATTLRRLQARGERLLQWFPELRKTWQREGEPGIEALLGHLQSLGGQVSRRAQETGRDLEARAERVLADLERQAVRGLGPLLSRANLASGSELSDLQDRLTHLEERVGPLLESRAQIDARLAEIQRELGEARADASERLRDVTVRLSANDELRHEIGGVHDHLDALSKEQVTRNLEIGKLHDRLVRLEVRMGDVLKEHGSHLAVQQDVSHRLTALDQGLAESVRGLQSASDGTASVAADGRATDARLTALVSARNTDHDELARLTDLLGTVHQTLRQVDLRLGDLTERHTGLRDELANLGARVSHLELAPARPPATTVRTDRTEGH